MSQNKIRNICWCSPHPNHYNNYLFQNLASQPEINLELVFFQKVLPKYPWKSDFETSINTYFLQKKLKIDWKWLINQIFKHNDKIYVIAGWNELTMFLLLSFLALFKKDFIIWTDTPKSKRKNNLKNKLRKTWLNFIIKKCQYFMTTGTPGLRESKNMGVPTKKLINFPFATNIEYFIPKHNKRYAENKIISSGRLDIQHKGYDTALKALATLKNKFPTLSFEYIIAGIGKDEKLIRNMINDFRLTKIVTLRGWLEPTELLNFYQDGTVLLHSSNIDPFPNAVLEAMACGLPVIGSNLAGSVEDRVLHGLNGFIFLAKSSNDLAEKLEVFLCLSEQERKKMAETARATAEKWNVSYNIKTFINIINNIDNA